MPLRFPPFSVEGHQLFRNPAGWLTAAGFVALSLTLVQPSFPAPEANGDLATEEIHTASVPPVARRWLWSLALRDLHTMPARVSGAAATRQIRTLLPVTRSLSEVACHDGT